MAIKVKRTTRDVAGWRKLSSAQRAKLEQEYLNTPEGREFSKRNPLRAGNKVAWQYKLDEAVNRYYDRGGQAYTQGSKAYQAKEAQAKAKANEESTKKSAKPTSPSYGSFSNAVAAGATALSNALGGNTSREAGRQYRGQASVDRAVSPPRQYTFSDNRGNMRSPNPTNSTPKGQPRGAQSARGGRFTGTGQYYDFRDRSGQTPIDARTGKRTGQTAVGRSYGSSNSQTGGYTGRGQFVNSQAQTQYNTNMARANASTATQFGKLRNLNMPGVLAGAGGVLNTAVGLGTGLVQGQLLRTALETMQHIYDDPYMNGGQRDHNGIWHNNYGDSNTANFWNYRYEDDKGKTYTDFGNLLKNGGLVQAPNGEILYHLGNPQQFDMPGEVGFERDMKDRMAKRPLTPHQAREIWDSPYKKYIPEHLIPSIIRLKDRDGGTTEVDRGQLPDVIVNAPGPRKSTPRPAPQRPTPVQQQPERTPMIPIGPGQIGPIADLEPNKNPLYNPNLGDAGIGNLPARDIDGNVPMPPMVRPTIPYLGGGIPAMREALSYYPEDYNPLIHRFDDLMFR